MLKCPNCGRTTARTEDWACQWCGYPLLSRSYKKIPKTYKQLKEEELSKQKLLLAEESEVSLLPDEKTLPPTPVLEVEPELISEPEPVLEPEPELEPKPVAKPKAAAKAKAKSAARPKASAKPKTEPEPKPTPISEPEPEAVPAEMDITVEELLSAYETEGVVAGAKFTNKILKVTGVVGRIEVKDNLNIYYITLSSAEKDRLQNLRCVFDKQYSSELSQLTAGQTVTVRGKYDGSIMDVCMRGCILVR